MSTTYEVIENAIRLKQLIYFVYTSKKFRKSIFFGWPKYIRRGHRQEVGSRYVGVQIRAVIVLDDPTDTSGAEGIDKEIRSKTPHFLIRKMLYVERIKIPWYIKPSMKPEDLFEYKIVLEKAQ